MEKAQWGLGGRRIAQTNEHCVTMKVISHLFSKNEAIGPHWVHIARGYGAAAGSEAK